MYSPYRHLLQPFTIGNITFRNRISSAPLSPHSLQASEPYPTEPVITLLANKARGGAACVTCVGVNVFPSDPNTLQIASWDVYHQPNFHYLGHLSERLHTYGARASMEIGVVGVAHGEYAVSDGGENTMLLVCPAADFIVYRPQLSNCLCCLNLIQID